MNDLSQELADKENEITVAEKNLDTVLNHKEAAEKEIAEMRIRKWDLEQAIRRKEMEVEAFDPAIRQARFVISRMKREHESLKRAYFQQRDMR